MSQTKEGDYPLHNKQAHAPQRVSNRLRIQSPIVGVELLQRRARACGCRVAATRARVGLLFACCGLHCGHGSLKALDGGIPEHRNLRVTKTVVVIVVRA